MKNILSICLFTSLSILINAQGLVSGNTVDKARNQAIFFTVFAAIVMIGIVVSIIKRRRRQNRD